MARGAKPAAAVANPESKMDPAEKNAWWTTLRHGGVLLSPLVLEDTLPDGPVRVPDRDVDRLRGAYQRFRAAPEENLGAWLDAVFEEFLGHTQPNWLKGHQVGDRFKATDVTGAARKPARVLLNAMKESEPRFLVGVDKDRVALEEDERVQALGMHGGRRAFGQLLALLRGTQVPLGLFTNGHQFRVVWAGLDAEAWVEWDAQAWFEGGEGRNALDGFRALLGAEFIKPDSTSSAHALREAVDESRKRQADLSHVMGTQVREAVEMLLTALDDTLAGATEAQRAAILKPLKDLGLRPQEELDALYQGAIRIVMRLVVALYAESRDLFPNSQEVYYESYGVEGLFQQLQRAKVEEGEQTLAQQFAAWGRLRSLTRVVYHGSHHGNLTMKRYGGQLFQPWEPGSKDHVLAALAVLEHDDARVSDATVWGVLERLRVGKYKTKGRGGWRKGPVDFSDLRTEYIGMMYEGLLDYQLRAAREEDGGIVVLNLGEQPALPLRVLTSLSDDRLKKLITELKKKTKGGAADEESAGEEESEAEGEEAETDVELEEETVEAEEYAGEEAVAAATESVGTIAEGFDAEVFAWAERAVRLNPTIFLSPKARREKDATIRRKEEQKAARRLILKSVRPGATYLVRWSGTRKGSGTFYTKPALAVPTVNRTLEPLAYVVQPDGNKTPRTPDEILALKVCDPAMGSGSFLVAALRYLTRALADSFEVHVFRQADAGAPLVTPLGTRSEGLYKERLVPLRRAESQEPGTQDVGARVEAELKRAVVEHCIYGVDLHPLAVELGKLSLWVETMDAQLTFAFLDHKLKCGNSLIGAWQVQAEHYPLGAWERELGDGKDNPRTKRLQRLRKELIVPEMKQILDQYDFQGGRKQASKALKVIPGQMTLGGEAAQPIQATFVQEAPVVVKRRRVTSITAPTWEASPGEIATYARQVYAKLHDTFDAAEQEETYKQLLSNDGYQRQKFLLDLWCAAWFWPIRVPTAGPLDAEPVLTPGAYYAEREKPGTLSGAARAVVQAVAEQQRFFHWEIEYPEAFDVEGGRFGFDAVVGNPPWETAKPQDNEFFTQYDPAYRTYGKQEGLKRQKELFAANNAILEDFWNYQEGYKSQSNFVRNTHALEAPRLGGSTSGDKWLALTRDARNLMPTTSTPYAHQGSGDLNLYKLFTERALAQTHIGGRIGLILPSGIYSDIGTKRLREQLYNFNAWEWTFCFENYDSIFDIHAQFRFACCVFTRGGTTQFLRLRSYERNVGEWNSQNPTHVVITRSELERFSPNILAPLEIREARDLTILEKIRSKGTLLQGRLDYLREFDMTNDSGQFVSVATARSAGYAPGPDGRWSDRNGAVAYPLVEGKTFSQQAVVNPQKKVLNARPEGSPIFVRYLIPEKTWHPSSTSRLVMRDIVNPTNKRTFVAAVIPPFPCGNKAPVIRVHECDDVEAAAFFGSYVFDFYVRNKFSTSGGAGSLNPAYLAEMPFVRIPRKSVESASRMVNQVPPITPRLLSPVEYAQGREGCDEVVARECGLTDDDMRWILRPDNPDPRNLWRDYCERLKVFEAAGKRGRWYTLEEAREIRRKAGMKVDF
jgi:hypothetical protein